MIRAITMNDQRGGGSGSQGRKKRVWIYYVLCGDKQEIGR